MAISAIATLLAGRNSLGLVFLGGLLLGLAGSGGPSSCGSRHRIETGSG